MKNIRRNVFESNSSSCHSICVTKSDDTLQDVPKEIVIDLKNDFYEFGWDYRTYKDMKSKLAYLIMGIIRYNQKEDKVYDNLKKLALLLLEIGVQSFSIKGIEFNMYEGEYYFAVTDYTSYVDHATELDEFVESILLDKYILKRYLFSNDSFVATGNDNDERGYPNIDVPYEHDIFSKGN